MKPVRRMAWEALSFPCRDDARGPRRAVTITGPFSNSRRSPWPGSAPGAPIIYCPSVAVITTMMSPRRSGAVPFALSPSPPGTTPIATLLTGDSLSVTTYDTTAAALEAERSIRWYLDGRASAKLMGEPWTVAAYLLAIDQSSLKTPVMNTLCAMVERSGGRHTTVSRPTLCFILKMTRVATITAHWDKARAAGLLKSKQRRDESSIHTFLIPRTANLEEGDLWGDPMDGWHVWTPEENVWWDSIDGGERITPPWGDGRPPF